MAGPRVIKIVPGSELDRLMGEAVDEPPRLVRNGVVYRLVEEGPEDIWANYDPEEVRRALMETAGSWAEFDIERMIADVYRWREEGSRSANRPYDLFEKHFGRQE